MADSPESRAHPKRLDVEVEHDGASTRLALVGELDLGTIGIVEAELADACDRARLVVLDLRRLEFIDSTGLRLLLTLDAASRRDGFDLSIVTGPRGPENVFELTGLGSRLPLVEEP